MSNALTALQQVVDERTQYFSENNLVDAYCTEILAPKIKCAFSEILPTIKDLHKFPDVEDNENITCVHYTSMSALFKMLCEDNDITKTYLKLYDSVHLNDPDEGNYLLRQLTQNDRYSWLDLSSDHVRGVLEREVAYIISFIVGRNGQRIEDNLVFWRTYGNEGKGCSLMFPVKAMHLKKVLYGKDVNQAQEKLKPVLDILSSIFDSDKEVEEIVRIRIINEVHGCLKDILYLYKSSAYEYENEVRIVSLESEAKKKANNEAKEKKICFDHQEGSIGRPRIRHYIKFDCASLKSLLSSESIITIGPTVPNQQNVLKCLNEIKRRIDLEGPQIKLSEISYQLP